MEGANFHYPTFLAGFGVVANVLAYLSGLVDSFGVYDLVTGIQYAQYRPIDFRGMDLTRVVDRAHYRGGSKIRDNSAPAAGHLPSKFRQNGLTWMGSWIPSGGPQRLCLDSKQPGVTT